MSKNEPNSYEVKYDLILMNIVGIVYFVILVGILYLMFKNNILTAKFPSTFTFTKYPMSLLLTVLIFWFVLHEIIHGIFYVIGGAKKENISYGCALEKGIFYCKCNNNITRKNAMLSLMAPFTIIGVITLIISFIIGDYILLLLSVFNLEGACADLCVFLFFLRLPDDILFREVGDTSTFVLTTKEDLTKKKYLGIKSFRLLKEGELPPEKVTKKVTITKQSKPILVFLVILIIIYIVLDVLKYI